MRIALFCPARLPVRGYGGTERVVVWLARGLAELGHEVVLLAAPGSRVPEARLVPVDPRAVTRRGFDLRPLVPDGVDLVHAHQPMPPMEGLPMVWTLHGNARPGASFPPNMICVSADHARRHGTTTFAYHGLDPAEYRFRAVKDDYDLFLGRLQTVKGWRWAVEGARRSRRPLVIAGGWRPTLRRGLSFLGEVDGAEKASLLAGARCLWMPAQWDEPFGLTLIEAMASGTPVLGTNRGSLPEIVTPEVGILADSVEELAAERPKLDGIIPEACRRRAASHFTHRAMARRYERLYREFLQQARLPAGEPLAGGPPDG
jgi:glycosyltransferase involved in cell wall biosynthesis